VSLIANRHAALQYSSHLSLLHINITPDRVQGDLYREALALLRSHGINIPTDPTKDDDTATSKRPVYNRFGTMEAIQIVANPKKIKEVGVETMYAALVSHKVLGTRVLPKDCSRSLTV